MIYSNTYFAKMEKKINPRNVKPDNVKQENMKQENMKQEKINVKLNKSVVGENSEDQSKKLKNKDKDKDKDKDKNITFIVVEKNGSLSRVAL